MCRGLPVAVKVLNNTPDKLAEKGLKQFRAEVAIHKRLFHPNVVLLMGASVSKDELIIVEELMHRDLDRVLYDDKLKLSLARLVGFARQAALGMNWLHKLDPPVIHRDLKPSNCLLDREMQHLKIADFGLSSIVSRDSRSMLKDSSVGPRGTINYLAPEVLLGEDVSPAADVYAFGVLLWQVLTRRRPYEDDGNLSIDGFTDLVVDEFYRPVVDDELSTGYPIMVDLMERCWDDDPLVRPDFAEICDVISEGSVEISIPHDLEAQSLWLKFFHDRESTKVDRLVRAIAKWYHLPVNLEMRSRKQVTQLKLLEILLHEKEKDWDEAIGSESSKSKARVTCEWFGKCISWLGPFDEDFLIRLGTLGSHTWFHGHQSGPQSQRLLNGRADGFYLVRFSATESGFFTISSIRGQKISHIRIAHPPCSSSFSVDLKNTQLESRKYEALEDLIEGERNTLHLSQPCPGSRFAEVTLGNESSKNGYDPVPTGDGYRYTGGFND